MGRAPTCRIRTSPAAGTRAWGAASLGACRAPSSSSHRLASCPTSCCRRATPPRCAATLNTANADWDLRGNIAKRKWDINGTAEQSDAALPVGRGANANPVLFSTYADKIEQFIHVGIAHTYRERDIFGGSNAACGALTAFDRQLRHAAHDPANPNASDSFRRT
jgi:hypothetical protein